MPRTIPRAGAELRGHLGVSRRQINAQNAYGSFPNAKNHGKSQHGPPFVKSDILIPPAIITGLVSYWKLDSGLPGASADSKGLQSVSGLTGTEVAGFINNAGHIIPSGGGTASVDTGATSHPEYNFSFGKFSFVQWFKMTTDPGLPVNLICRCGSVIPDGGVKGFQISITDITRKLSAGVGKFNTIWKNTGQTIGINLAAWYFIAVVFDLPNNLITLKIFDTSSLLDTVTVVAGLADYEPHSDAEPLIIASSRFTSGFQYDFDETGVWNYALSNAEILNLWNGGIGRTYPFS